MATKKSKQTLTDAIGRGEYAHDAKLSKVERAAHFLSWAAQHYPKEYAPYNYLLKAIEGYAKLPRLDSEEVHALRANMQRVKGLLYEKHGREIDTQPGVGVRACVDDADVLTTAAPKRFSRLRAAQQAVVRTSALIDLAKVPNTPAMAPWRKWFSAGVQDVVRTLEAPAFKSKLLPPAPNGEKKEEK